MIIFSMQAVAVRCVPLTTNVPLPVFVKQVVQFQVVERIQSLASHEGHSANLEADGTVVTAQLCTECVGNAWNLYHLNGLTSF